MLTPNSTIDITEEISEPELKAPWAMSLAMLLTYVGGFLFNIVLSFVMGDKTSILESRMEQPVAQIFYNVLGKNGGIFYTVCAFLIIKFVTFTGMVGAFNFDSAFELQLTWWFQQSLGRTLFAFSRDGLVPFSNIWVQINPVTQTPIYAVWVCVFWVIVISLIGLGSYAAIVGVFATTAIALDWSYCIPIVCKMAFGRFEPGPWHMGRLSWWVNAYAVVWTFFASIIFILPTVRPVSGYTMNYAIAFLGAILVLSAISWCVGGRKYYTGPMIAEINEEASAITGNGSGSSGEFARCQEVKSNQGITT